MVSPKRNDRKACTADIDLIRRALADLKTTPSDDGFRTSREIAEAVGVDQATMVRRVRALVAVGAMEVGRTRRVSMTGAAIQIPGYRLVKKAK